MSSMSDVLDKENSKKSILYLVGNTTQARYYEELARLARQQDFDSVFVSLDAYYQEGANKALSSSEFEVVHLEAHPYEMNHMDRRSPWKEILYRLHIKKMAANILRNHRPSALFVSNDRGGIENIFMKLVHGKIPVFYIPDGMDYLVKPKYQKRFNKFKRFVDNLIECVFGVRILPVRRGESGLFSTLCLGGPNVKQHSHFQDVPSEKIAITGMPRGDLALAFEESDRKYLRERLGIPSGKRVVLYVASTWKKHWPHVSFEDEVAIHQGVIDTFESLSGLALVVKLHPVDEIAMKKSLKYGKGVSVVHTEFTAEELMGISDLVVMMPSTAILSVLQLKIPLIVLEPDFFPYVSLSPELKNVVRSVDGLKSLFLKSEWKTVASMASIEGEKYLQGELVAQGEEACKNILNVLKEKISKPY